MPSKALRTDREEEANYEEYMEQVEMRGHMDSREEAERATRATLKTLAERLVGGEPHNLAAQLPPGIAEHLRYEGEGVVDSFSLEGFFRRVNEKDPGVDPPRAAYHARVVEVLGEAVTKGEMQKVRSQLPEEYEPLFEAGSQGRMST